MLFVDISTRYNGMVKMPTYPIISEGKVLAATTRFLLERGVRPYKFSFPTGQGINAWSIQKEIYGILNSVGIQRSRVSREDADIIGISETEWWQVECKGSGKGVASTQRNNFDRALASIVSYYEDETRELPKEYEQYRNAQPYLGLALPASPKYLKELKRRVRQSLRKRLNLWILLYEPESKSIRVISPDNTRYL